MESDRHVPKTTAGAPLGVGTVPGSSRLGPLCALPALLAELGCDPTRVLAQAGFEPSFFADPDMPIAYRTGVRLLAHCAAATGCEQLGLMLGERAGPETMGLPGLLLMNAPDAGVALRELARFMDLHDRGAVVTLESGKDAVLLGYTVVADVGPADELYDLVMATARNLMRSFCGPGWCPDEVLLPRPRPADPGPWMRCFRAPVRFGAARCGLRFGPQWLEQSSPTANSAMHAYLRSEAERLQPLLGKSLVDEVRRIVQGMVWSPPCSAARVAALCGMHERTLSRRLREHGASFRSIRDGVLYGMARQMLGGSRLRVKQIAHALGYADASPFIHAFTRWSGLAPDQWRRSSPRVGVGFGPTRQYNSSDEPTYR